MLRIPFDALIERYLEIPNYTQIFGFFHAGDAMFLSALCENIHRGLVIELGCFAGKATAAIAPICVRNGTEYHAVDWFNAQGDPTDPTTLLQENTDVHAMIVRNLERMNLRQHIKLITSEAVAYAANFPDGSVDLCFIDTDHRTEAVAKTIDAWWPKIKIGGVLCGHDYHMPTVSAAVEAHAKNIGAPVVNPTKSFTWAIARVP